MPALLEILEGSIGELWSSILAFLPNLLGAIIVFLVGLIIASVLRSVVVRIIKVLRVDELASKLEVKATFDRLGIHLRIDEFFGWIVKWFFIIVALIASLDVLGWEQVTDYLKQVVLYIPNVVIAVIILLAGIVLANFVQNIVRGAVEAAKLESAQFLSGLSRWAILGFSFMAALVQLQIAPELIQTLFTGLVAMLALAGGLAFGLGGKEHASRFLDRLRRDISASE